MVSYIKEISKKANFTDKEFLSKVEKVTQVSLRKAFQTDTENRLGKVKV